MLRDSQPLPTETCAKRGRNGQPIVHAADAQMPMPTFEQNRDAARDNIFQMYAQEPLQTYEAIQEFQKELLTTLIVDGHVQDPVQSDDDDEQRSDADSEDSHSRMNEVADREDADYPPLPSDNDDLYDDGLNPTDSN